MIQLKNKEYICIENKIQLEYVLGKLEVANSDEIDLAIQRAGIRSVYIFNICNKNWIYYRRTRDFGKCVWSYKEKTKEIKLCKKTLEKVLDDIQNPGAISITSIEGYLISLINEIND